MNAFTKALLEKLEIQREKLRELSESLGECKTGENADSLAISSVRFIIDEIEKAAKSDEIENLRIRLFTITAIIEILPSKLDTRTHAEKAAPDLLAACEMALGIFRALEMQGQDMEIECEQLKAAINKAKGGK